MSSGSFDGSLLNLTNWVGNAVMPIVAVLILAMGIYKYSRGCHIDPYIGGTMAALSVSGLLRLAEVSSGEEIKGLAGDMLKAVPTLDLEAMALMARKESPCARFTVWEALRNKSKSFYQVRAHHFHNRDR
jgi:energy-converting hydrogenase Eha subunit B